MGGLTPEHDKILRLTTHGKIAESKYYANAHQARGWRDRLRDMGYPVEASWVPASAFIVLSDEELDAMVEDEASRSTSLAADESEGGDHA